MAGKYQARLKVTRLIRRDLTEWGLEVVNHENIRRWFALKYHQIPDEKVIRAIYRILENKEDEKGYSPEGRVLG